jgi:hypothetical protein
MELGETWVLKIGKTEREYVVTATKRYGKKGKPVGYFLESKKLLSPKLNFICLQLKKL